jgi:Molybdopterin oxidoreductase
MLGLAHTLHSEDLHDKDFLRSHCVGYEHFAPYLLGESDGVPKDADWAAAICDIEADRIRALARRMASEPCLLSISWSLQRTENGDQPYWMIAVLGAMLAISVVPVRASATAMAASITSALPAVAACRSRSARCRRATIRFRPSSPSRASPTCCSIPAAMCLSTARS